ncbi:MAG: hypothetical protein AAFX45_02040 [Pseudomonadota bacterium]
MFNLFKSPPPLTTPDAVRDAIQNRLARAGRIDAVRVAGDDGLEVTADGKVHQFFLENAVVAVLQPDVTPRSQHKTVKQYVSAFLSNLDAPPLDLDRLYPIVRHKDYAVQGGAETVHTEMIGDLVCIAAEDRPETLALMTKDMLESENLAAAEVWGAARVNLSTALKGVEDEDLGRGLHIMRLAEPWLGASVLLAPDLFQVARRELGAEIIYLAAPSREGVAYIDAAAEGAFEHIQHAVTIGLAQDHPQSACIFTLREGDETPVAGWCFEDGAFRAIG